MLNALLVLFTLLPAGEAKASSYARPDLLIEPAELMKPANAKKFRVLDARGLASYQAGHIPGAAHIDANAWARAFAAGQDRADWAARVGALGVDVGTPVVIYDASKNKDAARIWWILRYWGVKDVRLLNGGWDAWLTAGGKADKVEHSPQAVKPELKAQADRLATRSQLLDEIKAGTLGQILDARSEKEYCGEAVTAKRNGAVPGARRLEWSDAIDPKTGRFKTAPELARLFKEVGLKPEKPTTTYCQSGGRAAVMAFVVELMGGKPARNYYRSWAEWGNSPETPIVTPKKK